MPKLKIKKGEKIKFAFYKENEKSQFSHISTFYKSVDDAAILISAPYKNNKILEIDDNQKLLFLYDANGEELIFSGFRDDVVKEGIRIFWKIRIVDEARTYYQRSDERYRIFLPIKYNNPFIKVDESDEVKKHEGETFDISAGGIAMKTNNSFRIGEKIIIDLPDIANIEGIKEISASVCWQRELQNDYYKKIVGLQFNVDKQEKDKILVYVTNLKKKFKLSTT